MKRFLEFAGMPMTFILAAWFVVLCVGWTAPEPMIGDEVTHYYMLVAQSQRLPVPFFEAEIPVDGGAQKELRTYPHAFAWHYAGAAVYALTGSVKAVQLYHSLYLLQLMLAVYGLAKRLAPSDNRAALAVLLLVMSLPMTLLFSIVFYQDVPAAAQILTAFYFLARGRWLPATCFMAFGIALKENTVLFLPAFLIWMLTAGWKKGVARCVFSLAVSLMIVFSASGLTMWALKRYAQADYYPAEVLSITFNKILNRIMPPKSAPSSEGVSDMTAAPLPQRRTTLVAPEVLANHPGDLRYVINWGIYGGGIIWLVVGAALISPIVWRRHAGLSLMPDQKRGMAGLILSGVSALLLTFFFLNIPDARFFYAGLVFLIVPLVIVVARSPVFRAGIWILLVASVLQSSVVLYKTYSLRRVAPGLLEAIEYLSKSPPVPSRVFMYPEGNYRLFPCPHEWYLLPQYEIRELWKGDNDRRLALLQDHKIGAIVIKKHLIGKIDSAMDNLGIYPDYFVRAIDSDMRFTKVLDNRDVTIYSVPPLSP